MYQGVFMVSKKLILASLLSIFTQSFTNIYDAQYAGIFFSEYQNERTFDSFIVSEHRDSRLIQIHNSEAHFMECLLKEESSFWACMQALNLKMMLVKVDYSNAKKLILHFFDYATGQDKELGTIELHGWSKKILTSSHVKANSQISCINGKLTGSISYSK